MHIERNTSGYAAAPAGIGYIITHAPSVHDIPSGGIWLFTWCGASSVGEDTLQLLDLEEPQASAFPTDDAFDAFIRDRSFCIPFDWDQTSAPMPSSIFKRVSMMFDVARDALPLFIEEARASAD